jgi:prepilin-type N-terminal cleavage/methylation domain-containing protein
MGARAMNKKAGMTLVELLVTIGVSSIAMIIFFSSTLIFQKQQKGQIDAVEGSAETMSFLQVLKKDLSVSENVSISGTTFTLTQPLSNGSSTSIAYMIQPNQTCDGTLRKNFICTRVLRSQGGASQLLAQLVSFEWCASPAVLSNPEIGPDCAALSPSVVPRPANGKVAPRRFFGRITIPQSGTTRNQVIPFLFTLEGMPWGSGNGQLVGRPPQP